MTLEDDGPSGPKWEMRRYIRAQLQEGITAALAPGGLYDHLVLHRNGERPELRGLLHPSEHGD